VRPFSKSIRNKPGQIPRSFKTFKFCSFEVNYLLDVTELAIRLYEKYIEVIFSHFIVAN